VLALIAAIVSPIVVAAVGIWNRRVDWKRLDQVATVLAENEERKAVIAKEQSIKLDEIHGWVNSKMTASMQSEYDALLFSMRLLQKTERTPENAALIATTDSKIAALRVALDERQRMQKLVELRFTK
jgi:porphobilinogen deaminase